MTAALPPRREGWTRAASDGCTHDGCGSQDTATVDGRHGRRCSAHPPTFDATHAVNLALRDPGAALAFVRTDFPGDAA